MNKLPFWIHQVVEYLAGLMLLAFGVRLGSDATVALIGGGTLVALAATADGPLAAFKSVPRRVHRVLDLIVVAALAGLAVVGFVIGARAAGVLVAVAAGLFTVLVVRTNYRPRAPLKLPTLPSSSEEVGRMAARGVLAAKALRDRRRQGGGDAAP